MVWCSHHRHGDAGHRVAGCALFEAESTSSSNCCCSKNIIQYWSVEDKKAAVLHVAFIIHEQPLLMIWARLRDTWGLVVRRCSMTQAGGWGWASGTHTHTHRDLDSLANQIFVLVNEESSAVSSCENSRVMTSESLQELRPVWTQTSLTVSWWCHQSCCTNKVWFPQFNEEQGYKVTELQVIYEPLQQYLHVALCSQCLACFVCFSSGIHCVCVHIWKRQRGNQVKQTEQIY